MFQILWIIAGSILGWFFAEIPVFATNGKVRVPVIFNVGLAFVGGLSAYSFFVYGVPLWFPETIN